MLQHEVTETAKDRSITTRYTLTDEGFKHQEHEDIFSPVLEIHTYHDKERKRYVTSITRKQVSARWVRYIIELGADDTCPVSSYIGVATPRYSAKGLQERHDMIVEQADEYLEPLIEWASQAKFT